MVSLDAALSLPPLPFALPCNTVFAHDGCASALNYMLDSIRVGTESLMAEPDGAPADTRTISLEPEEIYNFQNASYTIRVGNGGAGPSGILGTLAEDYQASSNNAGAIAWYQNISPLTLRALRDGDIDIALTYERDQEAEAVEGGWAQRPALIFNDHFVLVGPTSNPAGVRVSDTPQRAFERIAKLAESCPEKPLFLSRHDDSATNIKERGIFESVGIHVSQASVPPWYICNNIFPADALRQANAEGLYTLIDHGTFGMLQAELTSTAKNVMGGDLLRNPCYALLGMSVSEDVLGFLAYLRSERGQEVIARFGEREYGERLYTRASQLDFA